MSVDSLQARPKWEMLTGSPKTSLADTGHQGSPQVDNSEETT